VMSISILWVVTSFDLYVDITFVRNIISLSLELTRQSANNN
jgi:hypothetical protein